MSDHSRRLGRPVLWLLSGVGLTAVGGWLVATAAGDSLAWLFGLWIGLHGLGAVAIGARKQLRDRDAI
ncbi:MAG: hypothetical protein ACOCPX_03025 [Halapricum sp.]